MTQALLDMPLQPAPLAHDKCGFQLGWDHARHGLVPAADLLQQALSVSQGWLAGKAVFGHRTLAANRSIRQWLVLRAHALRQGIGFDDQQLGPGYLAQIAVDRCPVLRRPLGGATGEADAAVVECLNAEAGYTVGNVAVVSQRAARLRRGVDVTAASHRAQHQGLGPDNGDCVVDDAVWQRLMALQAFVTPLPFVEAARLPLALLPPPGVQTVNAVQGLQVLLTLQFTSRGWSARTRAIADLLPDRALRHDYNLFIGALAPRVLEATGSSDGSSDNDSGGASRVALEDAWLGERLQRRWQHFALSLGEAGTVLLLDRATAHGPASARRLQPPATKNTALPNRSFGNVATRFQAPVTGSGTRPVVRSVFA